MHVFRARRGHPSRSEPQPIAQGRSEEPADVHVAGGDEVNPGEVIVRLEERGAGGRPPAPRWRWHPPAEGVLEKAQLPDGAAQDGHAVG